MKVLVTELIWPEGLEELEASGEVEYDPDLWQKPEEVLAKASAADALVVRNQTRVDAPLLESGGSLKAVGRLGVGLDNIDLASALDQELVGGAVLDVLESEPPQADNPLLAHDRVVLTPHVAGLTEEAQVNTSILVAREVTKVLRGQPSLCVVG